MPIKKSDLYSSIWAFRVSTKCKSAGTSAWMARCSMLADQWIVIRAKTLLPELPKVFGGDPQLSQNLVVKWGPDFAAAMDRYRHGTSVRVAPPLVTSGLSLTFEPKVRGHPSKLVRTRAMHVRLRSCRREVSHLSRGTQLR